MLEYILLWLYESHPKVIPAPLIRTGFTALKALLHGAYSLIAVVSNISVIAYEGTGITEGRMAGRLLCWRCGVRSRWVVNTGGTPHAKLRLKTLWPHLGSRSKNEVNPMPCHRGARGEFKRLAALNSLAAAC